MQLIVEKAHTHIKLANWFRCLWLFPSSNFIYTISTNVLKAVLLNLQDWSMQSVVETAHAQSSTLTCQIIQMWALIVSFSQPYFHINHIGFVKLSRLWFVIRSSFSLYFSFINLYSDISFFLLVTLYQNLIASLFLRCSDKFIFL